MNLAKKVEMCALNFEHGVNYSVEIYKKNIQLANWMNYIIMYNNFNVWYMQELIAKQIMKSKLCKKNECM